jgi:hypothetical protein
MNGPRSPVQEGLTNALKYSADGTATLAVSFGRDTLEISLSNPEGDRRAARGGPPPSSYCECSSRS